MPRVMNVINVLCIVSAEPMGSGHAKYILRCGTRSHEQDWTELKMAENVELNHRFTALTAEPCDEVHFFGA